MENIASQSALRNKTDNPMARAWAGMGERFIGVLKFRSGGSYRGKNLGGSASLAVMGRKNDYLSVFADNKYCYDPESGTQWKPYPEGEERKRINEAFDDLVEVLRKDGTLAKAFSLLFDEDTGL